jgi:hypothetical protein
MLDVNLIRISENGNLKFRSNLEDSSIDFIKDVTPIAQIEREVFTDEFANYLSKRNRLIRGSQYSLLN